MIIHVGVVVVVAVVCFVVVVLLWLKPFKLWTDGGSFITND